MMATRMQQRVAVFLILAALPTSINTNKKYAKGEEIRAEDLCHLGRFVSGGEKAVEDLHLTPPAENNRGATLRGLERTLLGNGAHREVHSVVTVELDVGLAGPDITSGCDLVLLEPLSNALFADPFQLNRLQPQNAVKYAQIYGDVDLERPARNSFQSMVELRQRLVPDERNGLEVLYRSEVTLPLHARYPPVSTDSHVLVDITMPHVLINCRGGDNITGAIAKLKAELCVYAVLGETLPKTLQWSIPSGDAAHYAWVERFTTISAVAGVAAIVFASKFSGLKQNSKIC